MGILFERKCMKKERITIKKKRKLALRQCVVCAWGLPFFVTVAEARRLYHCSEKELFKLGSEGKVDMIVQQGRGRSLEYFVIVQGTTVHQIFRHG